MFSFFKCCDVASNNFFVSVASESVAGIGGEMINVLLCNFVSIWQYYKKS